MDFDDLVREQAMGLAMDRRSCFFGLGLHQTEDFAGVFVEPVFQVLHAVFALRLQVLCVGSGDCLSSQSGHVLMNIQIEGHVTGTTLS